MSIIRTPGRGSDFTFVQCNNYSPDTNFKLEWRLPGAVRAVKLSVCSIGMGRKLRKLRGFRQHGVICLSSDCDPEQRASYHNVILEHPQILQDYTIWGIDRYSRQIRCAIARSCFRPSIFTASSRKCLHRNQTVTATTAQLGPLVTRFSEFRCPRTLPSPPEICCFVMPISRVCSLSGWSRRQLG